MSKIWMILGVTLSVSCPAIGAAPPARCIVDKAPYGLTRDGVPVEIYRVHNATMAVSLLTYGGILTEVRVPDRAGRLGNVILTLPDLAAYEGHPSFSSLLGRYANRISGGGFDLDGQRITLAAGRNGITTHGGPQGFGSRVWTGRAIRHGNVCGVVLALESADGDQGFPGTLKATVRYEIDPADRLIVSYGATTTKPTVVTLAHHAYFNLSGGGTVYGQFLRLNADHILAVDDRSLPTGDLLPVAGTDLDLRVPKPIGEIVRSDDPRIRRARGLDHMFALNGTGLRAIATLKDPVSGRVMTVSTTEPGLVTYTANGFDGSMKDGDGRPLNAGAGISFELQHFPDSPHHPRFPSTILRPSDAYRSQTVYAFTVDR